MDLVAAFTDLGSGLSWLYLTVFLLVAADAVVPLVPGETALIAAGVLAAGAGEGELTGQHPSLLLACVAAAAGAFVGDNLAYQIGWRAGPYAVVRVLGPRRGPLVYVRVYRALISRGSSVLLAARFIPGMRTASTIGAGVVGYPRARFRWLVAAGGGLWAVFIGLLGYLGGRTFENNLLAGMGVGMGAALLIALAVEGVRKLRNRDRDGSTAAADDEIVKKLLAGPRDRVDGGLEGLGVVRGRSPEAGDLPHVLQRGRADVVGAHRLGEGRA